MIRFTLLIPVVLFAAAGPDQGPDKKELQRFEGSWSMVSGERDGTKLGAADVKGSRINWHEDEVTLITPHQSKEAIRGKITRLDPTKKPSEMDFVRSQGPDADKPMQAIYEWVDENQYRICFAPAGKVRPKEFSTKEGSGHLLHVWKRFKKRDG